MLSAGAVIGLIFAVFFAVLVAFVAFVLVKLGRVLAETGRLVEGITDRTVPLLGEVQTSVGHVNTELARVDAITANVQSMTGNVSALTALFAATLGSPVVKVAAFSYGVRRAVAKRAAAGVEREIKADLKASARAARADRAAARGARRAGGVPGPCGPCSEASGRRRSGTRTVRRCARGWRNGPGSAGGSRRSASARRRGGWGSWPVRVEGIVAAVQAEPRAQLVLALGHPFPDIGSEVADGLGQAAQRAGQRTGQRAGHALGREPLGRLRHSADDQHASGRPQRRPEQPTHYALRFPARRAPRAAARSARAARAEALRSALISRSTPAAARLATARRTPYEKAATLTTGLPRVAANSAVSAEMLPVIDCTFAVMASTRASSVLTWPTEVCTSPSSGTVRSVMPSTRRPVSASTRPSLTSTNATNATSTAKNTAKIKPMTAPADSIWWSCSSTWTRQLLGHVSRRPPGRRGRGAANHGAIGAHCRPQLGQPLARAPLGPEDRRSGVLPTDGLRGRAGRERAAGRAAGDSARRWPRGRRRPGPGAPAAFD